jgi:2-C-methyl-D-erythritol 2,4-cyclodiphosphate synthase
MTNLRIGHGYDVHRLVEGRALIIGGVEIPWKLGLLGHSDADVLTHAVMDALSGAARLGDIGKLFPDTDPAYEGADSLMLCAKVTDIMIEKGYKIGNIDATIIAQAPKMASHIDKMRENIARVLNTDINNVSIKATTEEKLGFTGEGLGISSHAVCLLERL